MNAASTRTAPERRGYPGLSGARALAAYAVVATHTAFQTGRSLDNGPLAPFLARLEFGVTVFFLLSGFLLSRAFLRPDTDAFSRPALRSFWWRRVLRILPAYWVMIVIVLGVLSARHATAGDWWSYMTMAQTYDHHAVDPSLSQTWTLSVELMFYFALPLLIAASRLLRVKRQTQVAVLLVVMTAIALGSNLFVHAKSSDPALEWLPLYLDWFALGILLASVTVDREAPTRWQAEVLRWAQSPGTCLIIGLMLFWMSTLPLCGPRNLLTASTWQWTLKHYLYGTSAFFFLLPLTAGTQSWPDRLLGNRVMTFLGEISYGVYLWHLPMLVALQQRWLDFGIFTGHFFELFVLTVLTSTALATLSWYAFERPLLRRFSHSWRRAVIEPSPEEQQPDREQAQQLQTSAVRP